MKHDSLNLFINSFLGMILLFGPPFHYLQEREGLLGDGLLFAMFYRDTFTELLAISLMTT